MLCLKDQWESFHDACIDKITELVNAGKIEISLVNAYDKCWVRTDKEITLPHVGNGQELLDYLKELGATVVLPPRPKQPNSWAKAPNSSLKPSLPVYLFYTHY